MIQTNKFTFEEKLVEDNINHSLKFVLDSENQADEELDIQQGKDYLIQLKRKIGFSQVQREYVFAKKIRKANGSYEISIPRSEADKLKKGESYLIEVEGPINMVDTGWNRVVIRL